VRPIRGRNAGVHRQDTIVAISSAAGLAARMIVRLSGPTSLDLLKTFGGGDWPHAGHRIQRLAFDDVAIPARVAVFLAPHSYTGEHLVEFHLPGNAILAKMLLEELLAKGARQADAGEFTARAFFNGRLDLAQAEGVAAVIAATNQQQLDAARQLLAGELSQRLHPVMQSMADTLALVEVEIDFSDQDVRFLPHGELHLRIAAAVAGLERLLNESARFERLDHQPTIVLAGRPNAGKSTLLNALAGHGRAVVSDLPGTTRDAISATVMLKTGQVRLIDVAGLQAELPADDSPQASIARQMQQAALRQIESADILLLVRDATDPRPPLPLPRPPQLEVLTKSDLLPSPPKEGSAVSAKTGLGLDKLREHLDRLAFAQSAGSARIALNARHLSAIEQCLQAFGRAAQETASELIALELREAVNALGEILGQLSPDDILTRVFARFCIGK